MSQWNNSYAYNNQYQQSPNGWNGDPNGQYMNQAYYSRPDANGQYVSFNEFLTQMQTNVAPQATSSSFSNAGPFENYPPGQYNYQSVPSASSSQTQLNNYNYGPSNEPNEPNTYPVSAQNHYAAPPAEPTTYTNSMAFKSNLTATAVEFVPKGATPKPSSSKQNIPESSSNYKDMNEGASEIQTNYGRSTDRNWRQRPQTAHQNSEAKDKTESNGDKSYERNAHNRDTPRRNNEDLELNDHNNEPNTESNHRNQESDKSHDTNHQNESNSLSREPRQRNYDSNNKNQESQLNNKNQESRSNNRNQESRQYNDRNQESRQRNYDDRNQDTRQRNYDSNSRNRDYRQNYESNDRGQESREHESNQRYESSRNDRRNQSKGNPKPKGKEDNRTFYNSAISKDSQDVRSARGENSRTDYTKGEGYARVEGNNRGEGSGRGQRNWAGTQRPRGDRNQDDEQYANNYYQKEDRADRDKPERLERDRGYDRERGYDRQDRERVQKSNLSSPARFKSKHQTDLANKEMTQRERLTDQLDKGTLECLVCCDRVRQTDPVWSCSNCYHVLHLRCIRKWAMSSVIEGKWRCPACQNISKIIPTEYRCMCGAIRSPDYQRGSGAHTCGKACKRERICPHPCTLLCHPGPCPPCQATVSKQCGCGAETRSIMCSSKLPQICGRVCGRTLGCNVHSCVKECHEGECDDCDKTVTQVCYCPAASERTIPCTRETGSQSQWACERACGRIQACGAHVCRAPCHPPPCDPCALLPAAVVTCPCGKMQLDKDARKVCTDPIPLCGNICAKPLPCGPVGDKHFCKLICHEGACPVCPDNTLLQCRCGHSSREVPCAELPEMLNNVLCQKKCNKKLSCGRHRCRTACCAATTHRCTVTCARSLTCGLHRCEEFCHTGHCPPCPRVSFEELRCECGAAVALPPVPCGARAPPCEGPCLRVRPCNHPPHHSCHTGECPPCVVLTTKHCYGKHEERKTIPCSLEEFSCGLPCGKPLPCGKHTCIKTCHKGPCDAGKCTQPCTEKRPACGHVCNAACHSSAAADSQAAACPSAAPCRQLVRATCPCGRRRAPRACSDNARDYAKLMSALAATKMQEGGAIEITEQRPGNMLKTLECDDECRVEARTRQMALALQIRNPDVSAKLAPRYSEHVRTTAAREPAFAQQVHDKLTELVQLAKKSKQRTRAHSFPSMNWQKRQFIHELCEHFGCESVAYDAEPNRNVVATADKEKSWLPAMSVLEVLGREAGKRRVPGPVLRAPPAAAASASSSGATNAKSTSGWATLTSKNTNAWGVRSPSQAKPAPPETKIDYFDNPPDN